MAETRIRLDKQIQKAFKRNQFPLSDNNGELQYQDINAIIKSGETQTTLNSVEVVGGTLVIKYTPESGNQQVVSTPLNFNQTDINVADAKLENPSAGVYRLIITETDGTNYPVDLSALLAVVCQNTDYIAITGNGTPQAPLRATPTQKFWDDRVHTLDQLDDVTADENTINEEVAKGGSVILVWNNETNIWIPRSIKELDSYDERTVIFNDLTQGNKVELPFTIDKLVLQSIKVFRNGVRQRFEIDYDFGERNGESDNHVYFKTPFTDKYPESVIIDYRLRAAA